VTPAESKVYVLPFPESTTRVCDLMTANKNDSAHCIIRRLCFPSLVLKLNGAIGERGIWHVTEKTALVKFNN